MKALELTVYPKRLVDSGYHRIGEDGAWLAILTPEWLIGGTWVVAPSWPEKRITDAELAACYWMSSSRRERLLGYQDGYWSATDSAAEEEARRMNTIHRFATLPHYDEAAA